MATTRLRNGSAIMISLKWTALYLILTLHLMLCTWTKVSYCNQVTSQLPLKDLTSNRKNEETIEYRNTDTLLVDKAQKSGKHAIEIEVHPNSEESREHKKWDYVGPYDAINWVQLNPLCSNESLRQSPINVRLKQTEFLATLHPIWLKDYKDKNGTIVAMNNGHSVNFGFENTILVEGGDLKGIYRVAGVHFHWGKTINEGSEHTIDSKQFPLEMHIVTYKSDDYDNVGDAMFGENSLAVLGILFSITKHDNPSLNSLVNSLQKVRIPNESVWVENFHLSNLLPEENDEYFRYEGSLTTPPCAESVVWTVFKSPLLISENQLAEFRKLTKDVDVDRDSIKDPLDFNWRPVQPIYKRKVYRSFQWPVMGEPGLASEKSPDDASIPEMAKAAKAGKVDKNSQYNTADTSLVGNFKCARLFNCFSFMLYLIATHHIVI